MHYLCHEGDVVYLGADNYEVQSVTEDRVTSVSYTHLDVYKRQLYGSLLRDAVKPQAHTARQAAPCTACTLVPVSYTHLSLLGCVLVAKHIMRCFVELFY